MTLLEPADPKDCDGLTQMMLDQARQALLLDDLTTVEGLLDLIQARVATITKAART